MKILPLDGVCYRAALFLKYFLRDVGGFESEAVLGYVNDGTDDFYSSHAWLSYKGLITDIAISRPLRSELQKKGPITIHGYEFAAGWAYNYHVARPAGEEQRIAALAKDPEFGPLLREHEEQHLKLLAISDDLERIRFYLDAAPDGLTYDLIRTKLNSA